LLRLGHFVTKKENICYKHLLLIDLTPVLE
jgi:hypothetical protein